MAAPSPELAREALLQRALARDWYHTIELAPGVVTPGHIDLRGVAGRLLPADLTGRRALDVGTFDGFWAFELERRGAEVVGSDLDDFLQTDWPPPTRRRLADEFEGRSPGERFHIARRLLGSTVRRVGLSIYDLEPEALGGSFDDAVVGDLLLHLRDPVGGLERVRSVLRRDARLLVVERVDLRLSLLRPRRATATLRASQGGFDWWVANLACLREWLELADFGHVRRLSVFRSRGRKGMRLWHAALECRAV